VNERTQLLSPQERQEGAALVIIELLHRILAELRRPVDWGAAGDLERLFWDPANTPPGPSAEYAYDGVFRSIGIFNVTAPAATTTPAQSSTIEAGGTATTPAAGATLASVTIPAGGGLYQVTVVIELSGTAETQTENAQLLIGASTVASPLPTISGQTVTINLPAENLAAGTLAVKTIALATTGAIYNVTLTATQVSVSSTSTVTPARVSFTPNGSVRDRTAVLTLSPRAFVILPYRGTTVSVSGDQAGNALFVPFEVPQPANAGTF